MTEIKEICFTQNELNNIIYLCLKYTFGSHINRFENPANEDINYLIIQVYDDPSVNNIIDRIIAFVVENSGKTPGKRSFCRNYMKNIIKQVMSQPSDLRNDLGEDSSCKEAIIHH